MRISVIVPTYKPKDYIWQCLNSLENQTLDQRLWELIIVLNGCAEPWKEDIESYLQTHHMTNARLIQTDQAGVSNARNVGLDEAKGEYIAFIDDDDYVSKVYLERLLAFSAPDTIAATYTRAFSDTEEYIPYYLEKEYQRYARNDKQPFYRPKRYFGVTWMKLIHRNMIGTQRFDIHFRNGEDSLFMFAISSKIRYIRFTNTDAIYYRRFRSGSASLEQKRGTAFKNRLFLMNAYHRIYWAHPTKYHFGFYITRLIACIHAIIKGK